MNSKDPSFIFLKMAISSTKAIIIGEKERMIGSITTQRVDPFLKKLIEKA